MSHIALEAIKVKLDSTGEEVVYEPDADVMAIATGTLVEVAKIKNTVTGLETIIEAGTHTVAAPVPTIPHVTSSSINDAAPKDIVITWTEAMQGTGDIKSALSVTVDGAASVNPASVVFMGNEMTLTLAAAVTAGQVVTWAYDDQNPTEVLETVAGSIEADNQTYAVTNSVA